MVSAETRFVTGVAVCQAVLAIRWLWILRRLWRRCHESPFRPRGGPASSDEVIEAAVVFDLPVDRLDGDLSLGVELAAALGG